MKRLCIRGDALLVVKQVLGVWKSKNPLLKDRRYRIKGLLKRFEERALNEEAHEAAQGMIEELFVLKVDLPLYCGQETLAQEEEFLLTGVIPNGIEKYKKYEIVHRACKYKLIEDVLYMLGADLVLQRVPWKEEL